MSSVQVSRWPLGGCVDCLLFAQLTDTDTSKHSAGRGGKGGAVSSVQVFHCCWGHAGELPGNMEPFVTNGYPSLAWGVNNMLMQYAVCAVLDDSEPKATNCLNYLLKVMKIANEGNVDDPYNTEDRPRVSGAA